MADDKRGRDKQADDEERRQRERELSEARDRADEAEPPRDERDESEPTDDRGVPRGDERGDPNPVRRRGDDDPDSPRTCHRRGCDESAAFVVLERYQEETGHGAVEATAALCRTHAAEESPTNLDGVYEEYVFRVEPIADGGITDVA